MTDRRHPVDEALRRFAGNPGPSGAERQAMMHRLNDVFHDAGISRPPSKTLRLGWAMALVLVVTGVLVVLQLARPSETSATMEEIASAAEKVNPLDMPDQSYLYIASEWTALAATPAELLEETEFDREHLYYLAPYDREIWVGVDGSIQLKTTRHPPRFFSPDDERVYYEADLDEWEHIGETITETFGPPETVETWPTELEALDQVITSHIAGRERPPDVEYLEEALNILRERLVEPQQRANTLRLIGRLEDLEVVTSDEEGTTFAIEYPDQGIETRMVVTLSPEGYLLAEKAISLEENPAYGIPANTTVSSANYTIPRVVDDLNTP